MVFSMVTTLQEVWDVMVHCLSLLQTIISFAAIKSSWCIVEQGQKYEKSQSTQIKMLSLTVKYTQTMNSSNLQDFVYCLQR